MNSSPSNPDSDQHLPNTYGSDKIYLMMQSPKLLFLYWDFAGDPRARLAEKVGRLAEDYRYVVRIINLTLGRERSLHQASETRKQWFDAQPGTTYKALVGLYALGFPLEYLLESNEITTPREEGGYIVPRSEDKVSECYHILNLYQGGDVRTALEVVLERLDEKEHGGATRIVARELSPRKLPAMNDMRELVEMRSSLISLYLGQQRRTVLNSPDSEAVAEWLTEIPTTSLKNLPPPVSLFSALYSRLGCGDGRTFSSLARFAARYSSYILFGASEMVVRARSLPE